MTTVTIRKLTGYGFAAAALAIGMTMLAPESRASEFDKIKAAAAKEGKIVVWHNTPKQATTDALAALFNKRFGMNIEVERVSVAGGTMTSRMMTEKRGGRFTVDVFIATDRHLPAMVKNGIVEKVDWVGIFGGPGKIDAALLESATNNIIPEFVGYGLEFRHSVFGIAYNTKMLSEKEVPHTWEGLTDPKWKRKVVVDSGLTPLARLVPAMGRDAVLDLAKRVVANQPIYSDGQPSSAKKIVSGEAPLGMLTLSSALDERAKGAPIDLVYPEPQAVISQQVVYVTKGAPHPNLAKLWAAWLVSEGMQTEPMVKAGILRAWPGSPGAFGEYFTKHHLKVRRATSMKELDEANKIRKDLDAIASGRGR
jgi:ABC-type Fe3+ transport system substrate-binding protein